ncbi:hypothetical protein M0R04_10195 [Candidatus Dojkabacteria bacterium]|jgi:hypothetical protein|nr:hypothetical protein [Candidatus Dojkabacteria bacterium]
MTKEEKEKNIETPNELEELKATVAKLLESDSKKSEMIADLMKVADKSRLEWVNSGKDKKGPNRYKVGRHNGQFIVGWKTLEDLVEQDGSGRWLVKQRYELILADGSTKEIAGYVNFSNARYNDPVVLEEISREVKIDGTLVLRGKVVGTNTELSIDAKFVN